jgi:hypothetical protein
MIAAMFWARRACRVIGVLYLLGAGVAALVGLYGACAVLEPCATVVLACGEWFGLTALARQEPAQAANRRRAPRHLDVS